jgi:hypothetical protein
MTSYVYLSQTILTALVKNKLIATSGSDGPENDFDAVSISVLASVLAQSMVHSL